MIEIVNKAKCCGCSACASKCPKQCIVMEEDDEGFLYPKVSRELCVDCKLCESVCPVLNEGTPHKPVKIYAARNKNVNEVRQSSSGGVFTLLATKVLNQGGIVFGAKFNTSWEVEHCWIDKKEDIQSLMGSKYVQSRIGNTYQEARAFLNQGKYVLFSGTPCQIAGLRRYLKRGYENLLTVDVVCHGVPSPLVWRNYLKEKQNALGISSEKDNGSFIGTISFRNKSIGWRKFGLLIKGTNLSGEKVEWFESLSENPYLKGFLGNYYLRPSCHKCSARLGKSSSDITLADFWKIEQFSLMEDTDEGTSLVLLHSRKAIDFFPYENLLYKETDYRTALVSNPSIFKSHIHQRKRERFWEKYDQAVPLNSIISGIQLSVMDKIIDGFSLLQNKIESKLSYRKALKK